MGKITFLFWLIITFPLTAQWFYQNPKPTGADIWGLTFVNNETGFVAAEKEILKTTDGGKSWSVYGLDIYIRDIFFINELTGWVGGHPGKIYKTTNGGETWFKTSEFSSITAVHFTSELIGFAAAANPLSILKTTDGGFTWKSIKLADGEEQIYDIFFIDENTGYLANGHNGRYWVTDNAGAAWQAVNIRNYAAVGIKSIYFRNRHNGYMTGDWGHLFTTNTGGIKWNAQLVQANGSVYDVYFRDSLNGWVTAGSYGATPATLYRTSDAGASWEIVENGYYAGALKKIVFPSDSVGYAAGFPGLLSKTTNSGSTWFNISIGERADLRGSFFINRNLGFAVGANGTILKTTDSGDNWIKKRMEGYDYLNSVFFVSDSVGYTAGEMMILKTTDVGETWFKLDVMPAVYRSIFFINENTGWAVGGWSNDWHGVLAKTTDAGSTWETEIILPYCNVPMVHFLTEKTGFVSGYSGKIMKTNDGGDSWKDISIGVDGYVWALTFLDSMKGFAAGIEEWPLGFICKTTDQGETWQRIYAQELNYVLHLQFTDSLNGFAAGMMLNYTTNGGKEWVRTYKNAVSLHFISPQEGWLFGNFGIIEKTVTGVKPIVTEVNDNEPAVLIEQTLQLLQNYPNPFNPETNIEFILPFADHAELRVYDLLGREISVIVNEFLPSGRHSCKFNAADYSSGVYFYSLKTSANFKVRKFIVLK